MHHFSIIVPTPEHVSFNTWTKLFTVDISDILKDPHKNVHPTYTQIFTSSIYTDIYIQNIHRYLHIYFVVMFSPIQQESTIQLAWEWFGMLVLYVAENLALHTVYLTTLNRVPIFLAKKFQVISRFCPG